MEQRHSSGPHTGFRRQPDLLSSQLVRRHAVAADVFQADHNKFTGPAEASVSLHPSGRLCRTYGASFGAILHSTNMSRLRRFKAPPSAAVPALEARNPPRYLGGYMDSFAGLAGRRNKSATLCTTRNLTTYGLSSVLITTSGAESNRLPLSKRSLNSNASR